MGFMKQMKIDIADKDARRAIEEGRTVYVHRFGMPTINSSVSSSVSGAADVIEAIEAAGWGLDHTTFHAGDRGNGWLVMIFRPASGSRSS